jgi:hypothetical protein
MRQCEWTRTVGSDTVSLEIQHKSLRLIIIDGSSFLQARADHAPAEGGVLFGRFNEVIKLGMDYALRPGALFSVRYEVHHGSLDVEYLEGHAQVASLSNLLEGEYTAKTRSVNTRRVHSHTEMDYTIAALTLNRRAEVIVYSNKRPDRRNAEPPGNIA